ncbi:protein GRAVITROPIC IN THE LIGHT 1 [Salvia miltiorrhiza]|uniref:protein GRAVITROPIC IN THE LIGHT 1 n=1 Tax=Salvia miltiorrhiza TaxID=226208 RepID=UPI0025ACF8A4|nr:protein GRAVITROPIC IN THE LIGHT 1 [Salvia miltiorrhiza]
MIVFSQREKDTHARIPSNSFKAQNFGENRKKRIQFLHPKFLQISSMYRFREMVEFEGAPSSKQQQPPPPPISDMFQKFALAFKTKTYELFAEEDDYAAVDSDCDVTLLLDSAEEFIPHQKVVVIKPDSGSGPDNSDAGLIRALIPSLFATLSSFEASYLQFQAAHVPEIDRGALEQADKSLVSILQKLTEMRNLYRESKRKGPGLSGGFDFPAASFWEFQVQENQSKLRVLETMVNTQQSQIDVKDDEAIELRKKLDRIRAANCELMRKLGLKEGSAGLGLEVMLTIRVFEAMLRDSVKSMRCFVKLLIDLMRRAGWDLEEAANSVYSGMNYTRKGHFRYAFLSYVCLGMFQNFDKIDFGLCDSEMICNGNGSKQIENGVSDGGDSIDYLRQLIEHVSINPMEMLSKNPNCEFSRFCGSKYEELIHPTMESSIFSNLDRKDKVLDSWKSLSVFYESFVRAASSIWLLHKLAYSFKPVVEIFQVERGAEFSMVYMEDVLGRCSLPGKAGRPRPRVGFTVVPGFKVGRSVVQSQVYLTSLELKHVE